MLTVEQVHELIRQHEMLGQEETVEALRELLSWRGEPSNPSDDDVVARAQAVLDAGIRTQNPVVFKALSEVLEEILENASPQARARLTPSERRERLQLLRSLRQIRGHYRWLIKISPEAADEAILATLLQVAREQNVRLFVA